MTTNRENLQQIELTSQRAIPPGDNGMMPFRMTTPASLVDVEVEEGAEIVSIMSSKGTFERREGQTWPEVLSSTLISAGTFLTLVVHNTTDEERNFKGSIFVEPAVSRRAQKFDNANISADEPLQTPRVVEGPAVGRESVTREKVSTPTRVVAIGQIERSSRGVANERLDEMMKDGLDLVLPKEGEKAVMIPKGVAYSLLQQLENHVPLHKAFRPSIIVQCDIALHQEGAMEVGGNDLPVLLKEDQVTALMQVMMRQRIFSDAERLDVANAIKAAVARDDQLSTRRHAVVGTEGPRSQSSQPEERVINALL